MIANDSYSMPSVIQDILSTFSNGSTTSWQDFWMSYKYQLQGQISWANSIDDTKNLRVYEMDGFYIYDTSFQQDIFYMKTIKAYNPVWDPTLMENNKWSSNYLLNEMDDLYGSNESFYERFSYNYIYNPEAYFRGIITL